MEGDVNLKKYFYLEDSPYMPTYYCIYINHGNFPFEGKVYGSYGLMPARLLHLTYANYLRLCRDVLGATLIGKGSKYIVPYFRMTPEVQQFVKLLNKRAGMAIFEHDHPYDLEIKLNGEIVKKGDNE